MGKPNRKIWLLLCVLLSAALLDTADAEVWKTFKDFICSASLSSNCGKKPTNVLSATSCGEGMECVPRYLCADNNTVIKDGRAIIDFRDTKFSRNDNKGCDWKQKCCLISDKKPNTDKEKLEPYVPRGCGYINRNGLEMTLRNAFNGESQLGEFPWMLRILVRSVAVGGGSLLTPKVAVTAAHIIVNANFNDIQVRAGEWDTKDTAELLASEERQVMTKIMHESFDRLTGSYDVALLILESPFELAEHIGTICLPRPTDKFDDQRCTVTGWGKRQVNDADYPNILKKIDLPIVNNYKCQNQLRNTRLGRYFELHSSFMCAGGEKNRDACFGDGGAPLACPISNNQNRYQVSGIVSWGVSCGEENVPGVYANIASMRHWIDAQLQQRSISSSDYTM